MVGGAGESSKRRWGRLDVETRESQRLLRHAGDEEYEDGGGGHGPSDGSVWGSVFNLCNSAIGAGILALPYAIKQTGIILGMVSMIVMCLILAFTNKILVWANRLHPMSKSYEKLVREVFGKKAAILVTLSVILTTFGACTGFLVIIADILPPIIKLIVDDPEWVSSRYAVTIAVSLVGILPLASLKNFNSLRFSSTMAIISVSFTVFVIIYRSASEFPLSPEIKDEIKLADYGMGIFDALPLISFAFGCHMQMIPIFNELKDNHEPRRPNLVIMCTSAVCMILYSLTAVFGYLEFPLSENGNILKNYGDKDTLVNVARGMLCFVIVCHYPPSNYCCRAALDYLFIKDAKPSTFRRLFWTYLIWALAAVVSFLVPKIDVVFGLIGATANSLIVFIFPALFLLSCTPLYDWEGIKSFPAYLVGVTILVIGILISIFGTFMIIVDNWFPDFLHKK